MFVELHDVFERLRTHYGPQQWWPAESPFEMMVGAILTQNTNWKNVTQAIDNLREAGVLQPPAMQALAVEELEELIQPAGSFRIKAKRLKNLLRWFIERYEGSIDALLESPPDVVREELLSINGVGPETADAILLYALQAPKFVVDSYTTRVLVRHGWIEPEADYHAVQEFIEGRLEPDVAKFNEFHALFVRVGSEFCRSQPKCESCPLRELLPPGGIPEF